ncbi:MAG: hypothetical protein WA192_03155 [Candidatus Acidiferrales bacterium]
MAMKAGVCGVLVMRKAAGTMATATSQAKKKDARSVPKNLGRSGRYNCKATIEVESLGTPCARYCNNPT